jgi:hypothetical protein
MRLVSMVSMGQGAFLPGCSQGMAHDQRWQAATVVTVHVHVSHRWDVSLLLLSRPFGLAAAPGWWPAPDADCGLTCCSEDY